MRKLQQHRFSPGMSHLSQQLLTQVKTLEPALETAPVWAGAGAGDQPVRGRLRTVECREAGEGGAERPAVTGTLGPRDTRDTQSPDFCPAARGASPITSQLRRVSR